MFLNASIPQFTALLRKEFLYDQRRGHGEFVECCVFGVASLSGAALGFHVMLKTGAVFWRLPIHAFVADKDAPAWPLAWHQLWDCFGYELAVTEFDFLSGMRCHVVGMDKRPYPGRYLFTIDWCGNAASENQGELGHKCAHVIELDNGLFVAQPNNRVMWREPAWVEPPTDRPDYLVNTATWKCEDAERWATERTDRFFYGVEPAKLDRCPAGGAHVYSTQPGQPGLDPNVCIYCGERKTPGGQPGAS